MKILSIRQPWAWAIIHGGKDVENRTWKTNFRGRFLIHAPIVFDKDGELWLTNNRERLGKYSNWLSLQPFIHSAILRGGIIGSVELIDCVTAHDSPWFAGPYGFVLKNPQWLPFQPCKGWLGFFETK